MISVGYPHMVLNSHNVPGVEYKMLHTWKVPEQTGAFSMVQRIASIARSQVSGSLQTVVFNSHGSPGKIHIGTGITRDNIHQFQSLLLENLVKSIWITACSVALIKEAGTLKDGNYFCYRLAQESGAFVKASTAIQKAEMNIPIYDDLPFGTIDDWEGTVLTWNPKGQLIYSETN